MKALIRVLLFTTLSLSAFLISASDCSDGTDNCEPSEYGISAEEIALNPNPNVELIPFNEDLIYDPLV